MEPRAGPPSHAIVFFIEEIMFSIAHPCVHLPHKTELLGAHHRSKWCWLPASGEHVARRSACGPQRPLPESFLEGFLEEARSMGA